MIELNKKYRLINELMNAAALVGTNKVIAENEMYDGVSITLSGKEKVFLGNCSYLGLETDRRLIEAAKYGLDKYGTFFSSSRAFAGLSINEEIEALLEQMYGFPCLISPTTTLGHIALFPVLIAKEDAIILDKQVHNSVQTASQICKAQGTVIEIVKHNDWEDLEQKIIELKAKHRKIWYMADGVYSMYGDTVDMPKVIALLNTYDNLYAYIDDSHGMSWHGQNGVGYAFTQGGMHEKIIYNNSLCKSFAAAGSCIVFPNEITKEMVRNCGSTFIFSGPLSPAAVCTAICSAQIHLSDEIHVLQNSLQAKIQFFKSNLESRGIPIKHEEGNTPVFFIKIGEAQDVMNISKLMIEEGYFVDVAAFPSVPLKHAGVRITINNHLRENDLKGFIDVLHTFGRQKSLW
jgi:7-keto-8-aminopelargonate synthetase-like enzyme